MACESTMASPATSASTIAPSTASANLQSLPPEILQEIASVTSKAGLLNLRMTCREIEKQTYESFCSTFKDRTQILHVDFAGCNFSWHSDSQHQRLLDDQATSTWSIQVKSYEKFLDDNPGIANVTTSLDVRSSQSNQNCTRRPSSPAVFNILTKLPNLKNLTITGFSAREIEEYISPQRAKDVLGKTSEVNFRIEKLHLLCFDATAHEIGALVEIFSPRILYMTLELSGPYNYVIFCEWFTFWSEIPLVLHHANRLEEAFFNDQKVPSWQGEALLSLGGALPRITR